MSNPADRRLFLHGFLLIAIALTIGTFSQFLPNKRMGLATHLEALLNGMLILLIGLLWSRFQLPGWARATLAWFPVIGAYCSVIIHLFASIFPSGEYWMPIAAAGKNGVQWQEAIVSLGFIVVGVTMLPAIAIAVWGMWRPETTENF